MKGSRYLFLIAVLALALACNQHKENPAAKGFNTALSDARAVEIADEVMEAMGGRDAWEQTRYLSWNFFGSRSHHWDKKNGDIRIESKKDDFTVLMNIHTMKGKLKKDGEVLTHQDSLSKYLQMGKEAWINDAYWLVMPYKLKDSGVTLKYKGEGTTEAGALADILELTFEGVGITPENKYDVYVDKKTRLVSQWAFYTKKSDSEPRFITPWDNYKQYGKIQLSSGRGKYELTEIAAPAQLDQSLFEDF